jgi:hypothetical protein
VEKAEAADQQLTKASPFQGMTKLTPAEGNSSMKMSGTIAKPQDGAEEKPVLIPQPLRTGPDNSNPSPMKGGFSLSGDAGQESIKLSVGTSLPQTGPEGIFMSFSVDYEVQGNLQKKPHVLVIERQQGKPRKQPVKINEKSGNLVLMIDGWRPTEGPFYAHIEDKNGKRVSTKVELIGQQ